MNKVIGTAVNRKDGYAKVTGTATYSAEQEIPGLVHGYVVTSTIAKGQIRAISTREAERAPGVIAVFTPKNAPKVFKPTNDFTKSKIHEARLPLSDNKIHYAGQIIGLVVADTFERARYAAHLVKVEYDAQTPIVEAKKAVFKAAPPQNGEEFRFVKGNIAAGTASAATKMEATYTTSTELHAPMEPHAIIAHWQETDALTVYEPSQWVALSQRTYAELFGLPSEKVRVIIPYLGGAFGGKSFPWPHGILTAAIARQIKRPLKVVISRRQMTANTGHRSETEQTVRLAAAADGILSAIAHEAKSTTSPVDVYTEACTTVTPVMYLAPNLLLNQELAVMNVGTPTYMRGPGHNLGMWALESAMDELAWALKLDPVELRLKNETREDQRNGLPFSAKHFADCLKVGVERFGWKDRPQPRSLTRSGKLVGWGMAASTYVAARTAASAKVRLLPDGTAHVLTSGNDMGTGSYTVVAIAAADTLGIPVEKVRVEMGDSRLPDGGLAAISQMTASLVPTVMKACQDILKTANCTTATEACAALRKSGRAAIEASASTAPGDEQKKWTFQSWGAHFCEVTVDEEIGRLRVTRWVSVMDVGRVINTKAAASQVRGGIIMGLGHALMEECHFDPNSGYPVVYDLATYHFPTHADVPRIDVAFVGEPDLNFNPAGARGVGEIAITGVSAAVANAVYHATGKRLRSLPLTPDKLIA